MITKADFDKLKNRKLLQQILAAEKLMAAAWEVVIKGTGSTLPLEKLALPFGRLQMRLALFLLQKESKGREQVHHKDLDEIKTKFEKDIAQATSANFQSLPHASNPAPSKGSVKSLAEASDAKAIALETHKHIKIGSNYIFKVDAAKVWKLQELTDTSAIFNHSPFFEKEEIQEVLHCDLKLVKEYTKPIPYLIDEAVKAAMLPCKSIALDEELARSQAQCQLYEKYKEHLS